MIVSGAVKMAMQYNKKNSVGELVDSWNQVSRTIACIWMLLLICRPVELLPSSWTGRDLGEGAGQVG